MTYTPTLWESHQIITSTGLNNIEKGINNIYLTRGKNVVDFGAKGDGISDDTAAIQAALDAVHADGGGEVYIPAGTYILSNSLTMYSYTKLIGSTQNAVKIKQTNIAVPHIKSDDIIYPTIKDIYFEGMGMDSAGGGGIVFGRINHDNVEGINMENVTIAQSAGGGIAVSCPITSVFSNVVAIGVVGNGFSFYGGGTSVVMNACYAVTCTQAGYDFNQLNYSSLNGCAAEACGIGYYLHNNCNNIALVGCGAEDQFNRSSEYLGVDFQIEGGVGNTIISGYSRNNFEAGIKLLGGGKPVVIGYRQIGTAKFSIVTDTNVSGAVIQGESISSPASYTAGTIGSVGITSTRPSSNLYVGQQFFDTTIDVPLYFNGTNWIDASGAVR